MPSSSIVGPLASQETALYAAIIMNADGMRALVTCQLSITYSYVIELTRLLGSIEVVIDECSQS
jgi:hypothetical protein